MTILVSKGREISKEFSDLKSAINMGRKDGRQKSIESAFRIFEKALSEPFKPKLSIWTKLKRYWRIGESQKGVKL